MSYTSLSDHVVTFPHNQLKNYYVDDRCVNYGVLPHKEAKKLFVTVQERKRTGKLLGGVSSPSPKKVKTEPEAKKKKKDRV